jgi:alanine racemase
MTVTRARAGAEAVVDLEAVTANARLFRERTRAQLMAVVKADGFGHGAVAVAQAALAAGADWLGVTSLAEAVELRDAGLHAPILSWLNPVDADFGEAVRRDVDVAVGSREHLAQVVTGTRVHLHLDTALARDGAEPEAWPALCAEARRAERAGRIRVIGVMGHLACADDPADPANAAGRAAFEHGVELARRHGLRPALRHLAATAATLNFPEAHYDLVRVGAGLVGIDPSHRTPLRPALTLTAPVVAVRRVAAGTPVGYGHTWRAPAATTLALVPLGYGDGIPRGAGPAAAVQLNGKRCPVVGRISMDQLVVDVGDEPVTPGDRTVVFGPGDAGEPTVADWARWAGTIEHEIVTGLGRRVARR